MRAFQKMFAAIVMLAAIPMVLSTGSVAEMPEASKQDDIHTLLQVMNTREIIEQTLDQMVVNMRQAMPALTEEMWEEIKLEMDFDALLESYVPIYDKYLSQEEIQGLITFYRSEVGRQFVEATPQITQETMKVGQEWGQKLNQLVMSKMGY